MTFDGPTLLGVAAVITSLGGVIVLIRGQKLASDRIVEKADVIIGKTTEIHTLSNSNFSDIKAMYDSAMAALLRALELNSVAAATAISEAAAMRMEHAREREEAAAERAAMRGETQGERAAVAAALKTPPPVQQGSP